jgi:hypothetical protein
VTRPWWATPLAVFCALVVVFLVVRDLFVPSVRDTEVWFGLELRGRLALLTAPFHWLLFGAGARGFWFLRHWVWPWASVYVFYIAISHLVWNLSSSSGAGWIAGLWQFFFFSLPAVALLWARPPCGSNPGGAAA